MSGLLLALNAGSSTLKAALFRLGPDGPVEAARVLLDTPPAGGAEAVKALLDWVSRAAPGEPLAAAAHRIVHGGAQFSGGVRITPDVLASLDRLSPLAPLHQPQGLEAVRALGRLRPDLPQFAAFDTAFHRTMPPVAASFALPREWRDRGLRRYGFHGLSYQHVVSRLGELDPKLSRGRVTAAHLGAGASLCAMLDGRSLDTTMGFSALDGLVMSTRPGALDPGVVLHLIRQEGLRPEEVEDMLYRRSGLLGVSGLSGDMRELLASPLPAAAEAVELFVYRAARETAGLAGVLGGLDGLVFTGGVGERSPEIRARICARLAWLGVEVDAAANAAGGERLVSAPSSRVAVWVIPADEERVIAGEAAAALAAPVA